MYVKYIDYETVSIGNQMQHTAALANTAIINVSKLVALT